MPTLAERWQQTKPPSWDSVEAYLDQLEAFDPKGYFQAIDGKPYIIFSDGSKHPMRNPN